MKQKNEERRLKKEYAIKVIKENPEISKMDLLFRLMAEFNMSRRYTQEVIDAAQYEVRNVIQ